MLPLKSLYRKIFLLARNLQSLLLKLLSSFSASIKLFPLRWINFISLISLLFLSPIYGAFWLLIVTFYFLFKGNFKNIFIIWGIFLGTWYLFFIVFFLDYESQILIGGEHTLKVMMYLCDKYSIYRAPWYIKPFEGFCFQTVIMLDYLSAKLGFPIYIPSVLAGLKAFISFLNSILGGEGRGPAKCAGEKSPKKEESPTNESSSLFGSLFKRSPEPKREDYPDLDACAGFKKELDKVWDFSLIKSKEGVSSNRYVYYKEIMFLFYGKYTGCASRNASKEEILDHLKKSSS